MKCLSSDRTHTNLLVENAVSKEIGTLLPEKDGKVATEKKQEKPLKHRKESCSP